ncbi:MAG: DUF5702 domain-containing protein [Velocimicrobium sp.]
MDKSLKNRTDCGEITIFLTLILLILLSFFSAAIMSARMSALTGFSERNLKLALQGVFSKYCRPLWDQYHLFMREGEEEHQLVLEIENYQSEITGAFYERQDQSFLISSMEAFLEEGGEHYIEQITKYMKYHIADDFFSKNSSEIEENGTVKLKAKEQVRKLEEGEEKVKNYKSLLNVIKLIEGAVIVDGVVKTEPTFIKQICKEEINAYEVGVNNEIIWKSLQSEYIPYEKVSTSKCRKIINMINQALLEIERMERKDTGDISMNCMFRQVICMKDTLSSNRTVLEEYLQNSKEENATDILKSYQIRTLCFEYGNLNLKKVKNPVESIKKSFQSDLLSLVMEKEEDVLNEKLPDSFLVAQTKKDYRKFSSDMLSELNCKDTESVKKSFSLFGQDTFGEKAVETALEVAYYQAHFTNYLSDEKEPIQYEQEFIIGGGKTEKEVLSNVWNRILLQRGMLNFMYLLTDKEKSEKAHLTAIAIIGYSGMEALVQIVRVSILLCWAMAEAVIDLAILIQGKKLPIMKSKQSFLLEYSELFSFGKTTVMKKAKEWNKVNAASYTYSDCLKTLLLLENRENRINRSLALIQKNMKYLYREEFSLLNGITGIFVEGTYQYFNNRTVEVTLKYAY